MTLYRGANMDLSPKDVVPGRAIDFGPASTSEDAGAALPYAESGDRTPVLFEFDGVEKALNVQGRAEENAGFAESEWITSGRYYVSKSWVDEDGVLNVRVSPALGRDSTSQRNADREPIRLNQHPVPNNEVSEAADDFIPEPTVSGDEKPLSVPKTAYVDHGDGVVLTQRSTDYFRSLTGTMSMWDGPGLVDAYGGDTGNLTDLKMKGLIVTGQSDNGSNKVAFAYLTPKGWDLAVRLDPDLQEQFGDRLDDIVVGEDGKLPAPKQKTPSPEQIAARSKPDLTGMSRNLYFSSLDPGAKATYRKTAIVNAGDNDLWVGLWEVQRKAQYVQTKKELEQAPRIIAQLESQIKYRHLADPSAAGVLPDGTPVSPEDFREMFARSAHGIPDAENFDEFVAGLKPWDPLRQRIEEAQKLHRGEGSSDGTVPTEGIEDLGGPGASPDPTPDFPGPIVTSSEPDELESGIDEPEVEEAAVPDFIRSIVAPGDKVYSHPQGSYIIVAPNGLVVKYGPDGKPRKTSASAAKLAVGHGSWEPVQMSKPRPTKKPTSDLTPDAPLTDSAPAAAVVVADVDEPELPSAPAPKASKFAVPMNFNEAPVSQVPLYVEDDDYHFQQKVDGIRGQLVITPGQEPWFRSKSGEKLVNSSAVKVTQPILKSLGAKIPEGGKSYTVDGELLDGKWYVFDLAVDGEESTPWSERMATAEAWVNEMHKAGITNIQALPTARTPEEKRALWEAVNASGAEGVMIKRTDSPYDYGKRVDHTLKAKVTSTADVVVMERNINGKENARVGLMIGGQLVPIGTISMQGKEKNGKVEVGDVVEVEYLWAMPGTNTLQQPRFKKKRPDKTAGDATSDQLRFVDKSIVDVLRGDSPATAPETAEEAVSAPEEVLPAGTPPAKPVISTKVAASDVKVGDMLDARTRVTKVHRSPSGKVIVQTKVQGSSSPSIRQWDTDEMVSIRTRPDTVDVPSEPSPIDHGDGAPDRLTAIRNILESKSGGPTSYEVTGDPADGEFTITVTYAPSGQDPKVTSRTYAPGDNGIWRDGDNPLSEFHPDVWRALTDGQLSFDPEDEINGKGWKDNRALRSDIAAAYNLPRYPRNPEIGASKYNKPTAKERSEFHQATARWRELAKKRHAEGPETFDFGFTGNPADATDSQLEEALARANRLSVDAFKDSHEVTDKRATWTALDHLKQGVSDRRTEAIVEASRSIREELAKRLAGQFQAGQADDFDEARWAKAGDSEVYTTDNPVSTMTEEEWDKARNSYVVNDVQTVRKNSELRSGTPSPSATAWRNRMDKWTKATLSENDVVTFRGIAASPELIRQMRVGAEITDPGIVSTDVSRGSALGYLGTRIKARAGSFPLLLEILIPAGHPVADASYGELVLPSRTPMVVKKVVIDDDGTYRVFVELGVPSGPIDGSPGGPAGVTAGGLRIRQALRTQVHR